MLFAHKLIDAATGRDQRSHLVTNQGTAQDTINNLVRGVAEAEKFDFGQLMFEKKADGRYSLPDLTEDEKEMWVRGYLPLPSETCWFEYDLGNRRNGLLVTESRNTEGENHPWVIQRVDYRNGDLFYWDGALGGINRWEQDYRSDRWAYIRGGNKTSHMDRTAAYTSIAADVMLSIYLTMMINSKTTEMRREPAPERLNRAREQRHQTPLFGHNIVNIVPIRFITDSEREATSGTHASPRLHWRRTHVRTLHRGEPTEFKTVIWRFLVGLAERGAVSHEYRFLSDRDKAP